MTDVIRRFRSSYESGCQVKKLLPAPPGDAGVVTYIQPHLIPHHILRGVIGFFALARRTFPRAEPRYYRTSRISLMPKHGLRRTFSQDGATVFVSSVLALLLNRLGKAPISSRSIPVIDVFAGPGGLGEGFHRLNYIEKQSPEMRALELRRLPRAPGSK